MSDHNSPNDAKSYTVTVFISFAVVFVFVILMMLWHGSYEHNTNGDTHYNTQVNEPSDD